MIHSFRHRGLKNFYEKDNPKGLRADQVDKIARILSRLDEADRVAGMDLPGFKLHPFEGKPQGVLGRERFWQLADHLPV